MPAHCAFVKVLNHEKFSDSLFHTTFELIDGHDEEITPGQFLMIRCDPSTPFRFMRPMSILAYDRDGRKIEIFYRVVGEQTRKLSEAKLGTLLPIVFPLGKGLALSEPMGEIVGIAGGTGIPPILLLAKRVHATTGRKVKVFYGARTKEELALPLLSSFPADFVFATDDGTYGFRGTVVELFLKAVPAFERAKIFACGPKPMLKALQVGLPATFRGNCQVSLEEVMACGLGACYGCAVRTHLSGMDSHKLVCRDGPVFGLNEVILD